MTSSAAQGTALAVLIFVSVLALGWVETAVIRANQDQARRDAEASGLFPAYGEEDGQ